MVKVCFDKSRETTNITRLHVRSKILYCDHYQCAVGDDPRKPRVSVDDMNRLCFYYEHCIGLISHKSSEITCHFYLTSYPYLFRIGIQQCDGTKTNESFFVRSLSMCLLVSKYHVPSAAVYHCRRVLKVGGT
jgi:hypothetical protein